MNLLCCADDELISQMTLHALESRFKNLNIESCKNDLEAIPIIQSTQIDLIISHYDIEGDSGNARNGRNGTDLFIKLIEMGKDIPFILYTGMPEYMFSAFEKYPNFQYIEKFNKEEMIESVASIIINKGET